MEVEKKSDRMYGCLLPYSKSKVWENWQNPFFRVVFQAVINAVIPPLWPADGKGLSLACDSPPLVLWMCGCALSHHQINSSSPESSHCCCGTFIPIRCVIAFAIYIFSRIRTTGTLIEQGALGDKGLLGSLVNIRTSQNRATWKWCYIKMKKVR